MERTRLKRRLAAVLLADVVGYGGLMERDEEDTHRRLTRLVGEIVTPEVAQYRGRPIRSTGEGLLIEFDSAFDAVRCGLEIQRGLTERNDLAERDAQIQLRIGINTGDVISDERDIYGNIVNIAARLEQLAEPGTVYVTSGVHDQLRGYPELSFADRGYRWVKNIDHPLRVFRVAAAPPRQRSAQGRGWVTRLRPAIASLRSRVLYAIAAFLILAGTLGVATFPVWRDYWPLWQRGSLLVLPFKNLSNDRGQDYIADAVTEDLTTDLSRSRHVLVIASATAFTFKGKPLDLRQIRRDIGVRYLVEGSINRVGARVLTNVRLIEAGSGVQVWADHFESDFADLLKLESEITARIANSLDFQLIRAEGRRAERVAQPDALDLRLRAEGLFLSAMTPEHALAAQHLLEQAVRLDPDSAEAWAWLADILSSQYLSHWNGAGPAQLGAAEDAIRHALALDPNLPLAHFANGFIHRARGEHQAALASFSQAITLDPNYARAYSQKGNELIQVGQPGEAPPLVEKAIQLSPRDPSLGEFYWVMGRAYFYRGGYDRVIPWLHKAVEGRPNVWYNRLYLASAYALLGETGEAQKVLEDFRRHFSGRAYTVAVVQSFERINPNDNRVVVAARTKFYEGLLKAGMAAR